MRFPSQFSHSGRSFREKHQHLQHQTNLIKSIIRYVLVLDLKDVNISLYVLVKVRKC